MSSDIHFSILLRSLYEPSAAFEELAQLESGVSTVFFRFSLWLVILPPIFSLIGAANFGWRIGAEEPLVLAGQSLLLVSLGYFLVLVFGLFSTAFISSWMASTYGADRAIGKNLALITVVGAPLAIASVAHLFPDVLLNMLVLIPAMIWSMYLLYKGIPVVLDTPPERGMLMASSLVGWLLVAAVSLLGLSMGLWTAGVGPLLGV